MATNLEKLRAKKAANQQKESDLSTSFTIDEGKDAPPTENASDYGSTKKVDLSSVSVKPKTSINSEKKSETASLVKALTPDKDIINNNDINPIIPIKDGAALAAKPPVEFAGPEKNLGLRLATDEDKRYLNMAPLSRSMTKKAFFAELMQKEFASVKDIDINNEEIERFRNSSLQTTAITISVPETLIEQIKAYSAKHMMKYQRYVAYVVNKARKNDSSWA